MSSKTYSNDIIKDSIKELKIQVNSLILSNASINKKLEDQAKKENDILQIQPIIEDLKSFKTDLNSVNSIVQELKEDNDFIKLKLASMEKRISKLEDRNLSFRNEDILKSYTNLDVFN